MATERVANLGYLGFAKQTDPTTPATPAEYVPYYDQSLITNTNFTDIEPIYGNKYKTFDTIQGTRDHKGDVTVMAEPNTTEALFDTLLTKTSKTGTGPYTSTFDYNADSASYTFDFSSGNIVMRYVGVKASKIAPNWNKSELQWKLSVSALYSFTSRSLSAAPTGSGPYTVALDTTYDPNPTRGLVIGDLIRFFKAADGTTIDATVATIVNGTSITTTADVSSLVAGDALYLRPATVSFALLAPFSWPKTEFRFGTTATAALSATQTRVETGSTYSLMHAFESDSGAGRSGGFDPAALVRMLADADLTIKKFFDTPEDVQKWNKLLKSSLVIRHFSGDSNQYECRIIFNRIITDTPLPKMKSNAVSYSEMKYHPDYDQTDGRGFQVVVINNRSTA